MSLKSSDPPPSYKAIEGQNEGRVSPIWFFRNITAITRIWSFITVSCIWACTAAMLAMDENWDEYSYTPWYTLIWIIIVTFLEIVWLINKCNTKRDDPGCCCTFWRMIMWIDNWKKTIIYILLAIPNFAKHVNSPLALVAGILILLLGVAYFLKSFKYSECVGGIPPETAPVFVQTKDVSTSTSDKEEKKSDRKQKESSRNKASRLDEVDQPEKRKKKGHSSSTKSKAGTNPFDSFDSEY